MSEVNHPSHYNTGKLEVIEIIEDQQLGFHLGNAVKYICRAGRKDPKKLVQDLEKAIWYIQRRIELEKPEVRRPNDMNPFERILEGPNGPGVGEILTINRQDKKPLVDPFRCEHLERVAGQCLECGQYEQP